MMMNTMNKMNSFPSFITRALINRKCKMMKFFSAWFIHVKDKNEQLTRFQNMNEIKKIKQRIWKLPQNKEVHSIHEIQHIRKNLNVVFFYNRVYNKEPMKINSKGLIIPTVEKKRKRVFEQSVKKTTYNWLLGPREVKTKKPLKQSTIDQLDHRWVAKNNPQIRKDTINTIYIENRTLGAF